MRNVTCLAAAMLVGVAAMPAATAPESEWVPLSFQVEVPFQQRIQLSWTRALLVFGPGTDTFVLRVNPELVLQGTGTSYGVIDEEDFPISDVDSEELDSFYDTVRVSGDVSALIGCATSLSSTPGVALCSVSGDLVGHGHSTASAYPRGRMLVLGFDLLVKCRRCDRRQSH